jgi:hypothetical protein
MDTALSMDQHVARLTKALHADSRGAKTSLTAVWSLLLQCMTKKGVASGAGVVSKCSG